MADKENTDKENTDKKNADKENTKPVDINTTESVATGFDMQLLVMSMALLGTYFMIYAFMGLLFKKGDPTFNSGNTETSEIIVFAIVILISVVYYFLLDSESQSHFVSNRINDLKDFIRNPYSMLIVAIFAAAFMGLAFLLRVPDVSPIKAFLLLIILGFFYVFRVFFGIDLVQKIFEPVKPVLTQKTTSNDSDNNGAKEEVNNSVKEEVFNISNNIYTYEDAKAVCKAFGSRLATYDDIENAYNEGAEWTSYGWSDGQHAYFPTQKSTWAALQKEKGHENDLGRPGVNGGYFANPKIRFGVNCYGVKPPISDADKALMDAKKNKIYPQTEEEELLDKKVKFFQDNKSKFMVLSGYTNNKWSKY